MKQEDEEKSASLRTRRLSDSRRRRARLPCWFLPSAFFLLHSLKLLSPGGGGRAATTRPASSGLSHPARAPVPRLNGARMPPRGIRYLALKSPEPAAATAAKRIGRTRLRTGVGSAAGHADDNLVAFIQAFEHFGRGAVVDAEFDLDGFRFGVGLAFRQHVNGALHLAF